MTNTESAPKKHMDYEILRLIAILGVVFNHTQSRGFELYMLEGCSGINYYGSLLMGILCKTAVPLFFMISGALLLNREEPIRLVLQKRVLRIVIALLLFSGILYLFWVCWGYISAPGLRDFASRLWSSGISIPYWFLYAYLGLMLMLPLLRPMVKAMSDMTFIYLIALHVLLYCLLESISFVLGLGRHHPDLLIPMVEPYLFYFIMGYYSAHRFSWELVQKKQLLLLWIAAILSVFVMLAMADKDAASGGAVTFSYQKSLIVFPVFAIYASVHMYIVKHPLTPFWEKWIGSMGGCVFGAYLLEGILRHALSPLYEVLEPHIHVLPACMIWVIAVVLCGLMLTWVLKKIPVLGRIL